MSLNQSVCLERHTLCWLCTVLVKDRTSKRVHTDDFFMTGFRARYEKPYQISLYLFHLHK